MLSLSLACLWCVISVTSIFRLLNTQWQLIYTVGMPVLIFDLINRRKSDPSNSQCKHFVALTAQEILDYEDLFILLSAACRIAFSRSNREKYINRFHILIQNFNISFGKLFPQHLVPNQHMILHTAGPLSLTILCFSFRLVVIGKSNSVFSHVAVSLHQVIC